MMNLDRIVELMQAVKRRKNKAAVLRERFKKPIYIFSYVVSSIQDASIVMCRNWMRIK